MKHATTISATELKEKVSEVINLVYYNNTSVLVERHGKPLVRIVRADKVKTGKSRADILKKYFGALPNFPEVKKSRRSRSMWPSL